MPKKSVTKEEPRSWERERERERDRERRLFWREREVERWRWLDDGTVRPSLKGSKKPMMMEDVWCVGKYVVGLCDFFRDAGVSCLESSLKRV